MSLIHKTIHPIFTALRAKFSHANPTSNGWLSQQPAVIPQDHPRGVVAGGAGDAAAGMGATPAMIKSLQRPTIVGVSEHRTRRKDLVQRQRSMKDVAAEQSELPLQIERGEDLPPDHAFSKTWCITVDGRDHEV